MKPRLPFRVGSKGIVDADGRRVAVVQYGKAGISQKIEVDEVFPLREFIVRACNSYPRRKKR